MRSEPADNRSGAVLSVEPTFNSLYGHLPPTAKLMIKYMFCLSEEGVGCCHTFLPSIKPVNVSGVQSSPYSWKPADGSKPKSIHWPKCVSVPLGTIAP